MFLGRPKYGNCNASSLSSPCEKKERLRFQHFFLPQPTPDTRDTSIEAVEAFLTITVLLMIF